MSPHPSDADWWREEDDDDRIAARRAHRLERRLPWGEDSRPIELALAYRHLGYSHGGIARRMDTTESTVASYLELVEERFGPDALLTAGEERLAEWPTGPFPFEERDDDEDDVAEDDSAGEWVADG